MRAMFWIFPILVLFLGSTVLGLEDATRAPSTSLRIIEYNDASQPREDLYRDFHILEDLGDFLVARPTAEDEATLAKHDHFSLCVDIPTESGTLYVVSLKGVDADSLNRHARVLYSSDEIALVAAQEADARKLTRPVPHYALEKGIRALDLERVGHARPFQAPQGWEKGARAADARIQAMVDQVNATYIQDIVQDLEDMGEREANSGAFQAETYLVNHFNGIAGLDVDTHHFSSYYSDNVIAELPGTVDPSVIFVVGGHYDSTSWSGPSPGADDNASGTAGVCEIARVLSQYEFKYTIRFIGFAAEEVGLDGSEAYCQWLVNQGADVQAMINLDMTAYRAAGDPRDVGFITNYSSSDLIDFVGDMVTTYVPGLGITQGTLSAGTSDHQSFTQAGYAACFPFEDLDNYSPYIHSSSDLIGTSANDFTLAKMITQGALAALATLAAPLDLEIGHTALADSTTATGPYKVEADVSSMIGTTVSDVTLYYDIGGGYVAKPMAPTGVGNGYVSSIPGMANAGYVNYYIEAVDDQGNPERAPDGFGPDAYSFFVGYFVDMLAEDFEAGANGWIHGGTAQNDWQQGNPGGIGSYDPSDAASGVKVWGNDLTMNGDYESYADNWLESPAFDCSGATGVFLRYSRWLTVEKGIYDQATIEVNRNEVYVNPPDNDLIDNSWTLHEIDISSIADNNPNVKLRFALDTDVSVERGGWTIDDLHVGYTEDGDEADLGLSEVYLTLYAGDSIDFMINGGPSLGGRIYVLLMSGSGTAPGTPVGSVVLPLNWDDLSQFGMDYVNTALFSGFLGTLDGSGQATATLNMPALVEPAALGVVLDFAWITYNPIDYASQPVGIVLVP